MNEQFYNCLIGSLLLISICDCTADTRVGYVVGWGNNSSAAATGAAGNAYEAGVVKVDGQTLSNAVAISAGMHHSLALKSDGTVAGWGWNASGRAIGVDSAFQYTNGLVRIDGQILGGIKSVSAFQYSLGIRTNGTPVIWGKSSSGKSVTIPSDAVRLLAGVAGPADFGLLLKADGTLLSTTTWGGSAIPSGLSNVVAVATSERNTIPHNLSLRCDGTIVEWSGSSQASQMFPAVKNVRAIAAGAYFGLALKTDGTVVCWNADGSKRTDVPADLRNVIAIAASKNNTLDREAFSMALKSDGTVSVWGNFSKGHVAFVPSGLSDVIAIAAGDGFCLAITTNKAVAERFMQKEK